MLKAECWLALPNCVGEAHMTSSSFYRQARNHQLLTSFRLPEPGVRVECLTRIAYCASNSLPSTSCAYLADTASALASPWSPPHPFKPSIAGHQHNFNPAECLCPSRYQAIALRRVQDALELNEDNTCVTPQKQTIGPRTLTRPHAPTAGGLTRARQVL
jgi:hypothetical protein